MCRHRLEKHKLGEQVLGLVNGTRSQRGLLLQTGTAVDASLIAASTSTKNHGKFSEPEMHRCESSSPAAGADGVSRRG